MFAAYARDVSGPVGGEVSAAQRVRLGIFGGTFDPVHIGHLVAATRVQEVLGLDRVLMVVANEPWQKTGARSVTPPEARFRVVAAAVADVPGLEASRIEIDRGGPSYTADTVAELMASDPAVEPFVIVGADVAAELDTWKRVEEVRELATLVVVERGGVLAKVDLPGWRVERVRIPALDISSSELRTRLAEGRSVDFLIPPPAIRCIRQLNLYADCR
jgi:nicotinate-nucleotide adenylyltransferase